MIFFYLCLHSLDVLGELPTGNLIRLELIANRKQLAFIFAYL